MGIASDKNKLIMLLIDIDWIFDDRLLAIDNAGFKCSHFSSKFQGTDSLVLHCVSATTHTVATFKVGTHDGTSRIV